MSIHSYPSEECCDAPPEPTKPVSNHTTSSAPPPSEPFPNIKLYEPSYAIDFGSVIQRERARLDSMEKNLVAAVTGGVEGEGGGGFHVSDEEDTNFNSHQDQDTGHALLF